VGLLGSALRVVVACDHSTASESPVAPGRASLLVPCTQLDTASLIGSRTWQPRTFATVWAKGGEATIWESSKGGELVERVAPGLGMVRLEDDGEVSALERVRQLRQIGQAATMNSKTACRRAAVMGPAAPLAEVRASSVRRTRRRVKLWAVENDGVRLVTMTYRGEGQRSHPAVVKDVAQFRRRLLVAYPGAAVLTAPEWHPGTCEKPSHGWHVHVALTQFVPWPVLARCWGLGGVHVERFRKSGTGPVSARLVGRYLAKYLSKSLADGRRPRGSHSYEVTQGTQPKAIRLSGLDPDAVRAVVLALLGGSLRYEWSSSGADGWLGPPTVFLQV
jgi:hypothetical protein